MTSPASSQYGAMLLQAWLSPAFPTGAFAYSHGIEFAYESGDLTDLPNLTDWLGDLLERGSLRNDLVLVAMTLRAAIAEDDEALAAVAELAIALAGSAERHLETVQQGNAFFDVVSKAWPATDLNRFRSLWPGNIALPVAFGVAAGGHGIGVKQALPAYGLATVASLVSAAVRLGVVGQSDGQRTISQFIPLVSAIAERLENAGEDDLGSSTFRSDLMSLRHETQYTRLFRS